MSLSPILFISSLSDPGTIAKLPTRRVLIVNDQLSYNKQLFINISFFSFLFFFSFSIFILSDCLPHSLSPISCCDFSLLLFLLLCPSVPTESQGPFFVALSGSERVIRRGLLLFRFVFPSAAVSFLFFSSNIRRACHSRRRFLGFVNIFRVAELLLLFFSLPSALCDEQSSSKKCASIGDEGLRGARNGRSRAFRTFRENWIDR